MNMVIYYLQQHFYMNHNLQQYLLQQTSMPDGLIQLFINTWISQTGQLFDFNTKEPQQYGNFKASSYQLPIPKHFNSEHYYFIHRSTFNDQKHSFIVERRKTNQSVFNFRFSNPAYNKIVVAFKIYTKKVQGSKKSAVFLKFLEPNQFEVAQINNVKQAVLTEKPYTIVKSFRHGYPLKENQIVKFGKTQMAIRQVAAYPIPLDFSPEQTLVINNVSRKKHQSSTLTESQHLQQYSQIMLQDIEGEEGNQQPICKVCYQLQTFENPLIAPCNCKGYLKYIHIACLKQWLQLKLKKSQSGESGNSYNIKELFCQICKKNLPKKVILNGRQFILLTFLEDFTPYIAVQYSSESGMALNDPVFVTVLPNMVTTVGRLQESGVVLYDNSVSRKHALIRLQEEKGMFLLQDIGSKYGTLVYEKGVQIRLHSTLRAVQIGNTVFSFKLIQQR